MNDTKSDLCRNRNDKKQEERVNKLCTQVGEIKKYSKIIISWKEICIDENRVAAKKIFRKIFVK